MDQDPHSSEHFRLPSSEPEPADRDRLKIDHKMARQQGDPGQKRAKNGSSRNRKKSWGLPLIFCQILAIEGRRPEKVPSSRRRNSGLFGPPEPPNLRKNHFLSKIPLSVWILDVRISSQNFGGSKKIENS